MRTSVSRYFKDNLVGFLALFVALGGTGAYAANEWNSSNIQNEILTGADVKGRVGTYEDPAVNGSLTTYDIAGHAANAGNGTRFIDGSLTGQDVKDNSLVGADVNESTFNLAAEPWREVGSAGEPAFNAPFAAGGCSWSNYGPTTAAFLRDRFGFVHLKGVVRVRDGNTYACGQWAPDPTIFYLPGCSRQCPRGTRRSPTASWVESTLASAATRTPLSSSSPGDLRRREGVGLARRDHLPRQIRPELPLEHQPERATLFAVRPSP